MAKKAAKGPDPFDVTLLTLGKQITALMHAKGYVQIRFTNLDDVADIEMDKKLTVTEEKRVRERRLKQWMKTQTAERKQDAKNARANGRAG